MSGKGKIIVKDPTPLQKIVLSSEFDAFIIAVILLNAIFIASDVPTTPSKPHYVVVGNWIFNVIFILEMVMKMAAFGILPYFMEYWHYLDAIVVGSSIVEIIFAILYAISKLIKGFHVAAFNASVYRVLRVIRIVRILRPLRTLSYLKSLIQFVESLTNSLDFLALTTGLFLMALISISFVTNSIVNDRLLNRCVPTFLNGAVSTEAAANAYYQTYGLDYYYSKYNLRVCGKLNTCDAGFSCTKISQLSFQGILADYSTPWKSFKSNLSFAFLRGWPQVFSAIALSRSSGYAYCILGIVGIGVCLLLGNFYPALFVMSLKRGMERVKRLEWIKAYPGDKHVVDELSLFMWAERNPQLFLHLELKSKETVLMQLNDAMLWVLKRFCCYTPKSAKPKPADAEVEAEEIKDLSKYVDPDNDPDFGKGKWCVPRCRSCLSLRRMFTSDWGPFAMFINAVIVVNILLLAADAETSPASVQFAVQVCNIVFTTIFLAEVVIKNAILGPCLYFSNPYNVVDFILVIASLPVYTNSNYTFINNFRIIRLARLIRLIRIARMQQVVRDQQTRAKGHIAVPNPVIGLTGLLGVASDLFAPAANLFACMMILMYLFALLGMQFFVRPDHLLDPTVFAKITTANPPELVDPNALWSGRYVLRMNWNNFGQAFVTMFNIGVLNGWYQLMIDNVLKTNHEYTLWYFFGYAFLITFVLNASMTASVVYLMGANAKAVVCDIAAANKSIVDRYALLFRREKVRTYFAVLKRNTIETEDAKRTKSEAVGGAGGTAAPGAPKREMVGDAFDDPPEEVYWQKVFTERRNYSMYLFSDKKTDFSGRIRQLCGAIVNSYVFQLLVAFAILLAVSSILYGRQYTPNAFAVESYQVIIFITEMGLYWVELGLYGSPEAYFSSPMRVVDFLVNIAMLYGIGNKDSVLNDLRAFRLLKVPPLIMYLDTGDTLKLFFRTLFDAIPSLMSVIAVLLGMIFFFAVISMKLWGGRFGLCSYKDYPGGRGRYETDPIHFPTGCSGTGYATVGNSTVTLTNLHWKVRLDDFESIFTSCKSILRVLMSNEWQSILYDAMDSVGKNIQPLKNNSRARGGMYFTFLLLISIAGVTVSSVYVAIFYYHYFITSVLSGRKPLFGAQDALWSMYEERLCRVKPAVQRTITVPKQEYSPLRYKLFMYMRSPMYKFLVVLFICIPICLLMGYYDISYNVPIFIGIDAIFTAVYIIEYCFRQVVEFDYDGLRKIVHFRDRVGFYLQSVFRPSVQGGQEMFVIFFLVCDFFACIYGVTRGASSRRKYYLALIKAAAVIRTYRLCILYPALTELIQILFNSLSGFVPFCLYAALVVLIYGILGSVTIGRHQTIGENGFNTPFLDNRYNFVNFANSWITILVMGTGNVWTEIMDRLKQGRPYYWQVYVEAYFNSFYLFFFVILKSFPIQIVIKFEEFFGADLGIARQQILIFKRAWGRAASQDTISYKKLHKLLKKELPPPLGLAGCDVNHLELSRFVKKILLCMPMDCTRFDDSDEDKSRIMFPAENLPPDIRVTNPETWYPDSYRFSFRQVLIAVHKCAIYPPRLSDEAESNSTRAVHKARLSKAVIMLGRMTLARFDSVSYLLQASLLIQRLDKGFFRSTFVQIMTAQLKSLRLKTNVYSFTPFDSFVISNLRKALILEHRAARLNLELRIAQQKATYNSQTSAELVLGAKYHFHNVSTLLKFAEDLFDQHVDRVWDIKSLEQIVGTREKKAVSAVAIDHNNRVFVALNNGLLRIYQLRTSGTDGDKTTALRFVQKLPLKKHIRCLAMAPDGKKLFVACGNEIAVINTAAGRGRKKNKLRELGHRMSEHRGAVNVVLIHGKYIVSGGQDAYVYLWKAGAKDSVNSYNAGSAVFCACVLELEGDNVSSDEAPLTHVMVCGLSSGYITLLPLPSLQSGANQKDNGTIYGQSIQAGDMGVSAVKVAWGFVYAGFTNGCVRTWAVKVDKGAGGGFFGTAAINTVQLILVNDVLVHAGPVTSLQYTGGHLFSASYDFSFIAWEAPDKLSSKSKADFAQNYEQGRVFHNNPIISMAANKEKLVSGDDGGRLVIASPKSIRDDFLSGGAGKLDSSKPRFTFSFLEYDFGKCLTGHNGGISEEETVLTVRNVSQTPFTVRCLLKPNHPFFRVEMDEFRNFNVGVERLMIKVPGSKLDKPALRLGPMQTAHFRVIFVPSELRTVHTSIEFQIDEKDLVKIQVRGTGIKARLLTENNVRMHDLGTVYVGETNIARIKLQNHDDRDLIVNCVESFEDDEMEDEDGNFRVVVLAELFLAVIPRCFCVPANENTEIVIRFTPMSVVDTFEIPIKAIFAGGMGTMCRIRGRAIKKEDRGGVIKNDAASSLSGMGLGLGAQPQFSLFDERKAVQYLYRGLRELEPTEAVCPSDLVVSVLNKVGWRLASYGDYTVLMNVETGVFLEIPNASLNEREPLPRIDTFAIQYFSDVDSYFEVWYGDRLLTFGAYKPAYDPVTKAPIGNSIQISAEALFHEGGSAQEKLRKTVGTQKVELMIFSRTGRALRRKHQKKLSRPETGAGQDKNFQLQQITYIKVFKGFHVGLSKVNELMFPTLDLQERVVVAGITLNMSFIDGNLATVYELFEPIDRIPGVGSTGTSAGRGMFSAAIVSLNVGSLMSSYTYDLIHGTGIADPNDPNERREKLPPGKNPTPTHFKVFDRPNGKTTNEILDSFKDLSGTETVYVERPKILASENYAEVYRRIEVAYYVKQGNAHVRKDHLLHRAGDFAHTGGSVSDATSVAALSQAQSKALSNRRKSTASRASSVASSKAKSDGKDQHVKTFFEIADPAGEGDKKDGDGEGDGDDDEEDDDDDEGLPRPGVDVHSMYRRVSPNVTSSGTRTHSQLPQAIYSPSHQVSVSALGSESDADSDRVRVVDSLVDQVILNKDPEQLRVSNLYNGQWYFILDHNCVKITSSDHFGRLSQDPDAIDVSLTPQGLVAAFQAEFQPDYKDENGRDKPIRRCIATDDGRYYKRLNLDELPKQVKGRDLKSRSTNLHGTISDFKDAPLFLSNKWQRVVKSNLLKRVLKAMKRMVERRNHLEAGLAAAEAVKASEALGKDGKPIKSRGKKAVTAAAAYSSNIPTPSDISAPDVYEQLVRVTEEFAAARRGHDAAQQQQLQQQKEQAFRKSTGPQLSLDHLVAYLEAETLAGFDAPLTKAEVDVLLLNMDRDSSTHIINGEQFRQWFLSNDDKKLAAELTEKRVFAYLLEEEVRVQEEIRAEEVVDEASLARSRRALIGRSESIRRLIPPKMVAGQTVDLTTANAHAGSSIFSPSVTADTASVTEAQGRGRAGDDGVSSLGSADETETVESYEESEEEEEESEEEEVSEEDEEEDEDESDEDDEDEDEEEDSEDDDSGEDDEDDDESTQEEKEGRGRGA